jgi:rhodanese-related sulfurtransferase
MDVPRIEPAQIADALRQGERVVYVDSRSPNAWEAATEQIPGSHRIIADEARDRAHELPPAAVTVVYCT